MGPFMDCPTTLDSVLLLLRAAEHRTRLSHTGVGEAHILSIVKSHVVIKLSWN